VKTLFQRGIQTCIYLVLILFLALPLAPVHAEAITITANQATLHFPDRIKFDLSANSPADIESATLIYGTSSDFLCAANSARQDIPFAPTPRVYLTWTWDLTLSGILPPGTDIWWQWEVHDAEGATTLTEVKKFTIEDPAFKWQKLQQGNVTVYWEKGSDSFGAFLLNETVTSLPRLAAASGIQYSGKVRLMVYPSAKEVLDAAPRLPDWIGGVTFPEYGTVMVGIGPGETQWAEAVIPHELEHLVTSRRIFNCQGSDLPTWLSEGLATFAEGPASFRDKDLVMKALEQDNLSQLVLLKKGFSSDAAIASQDYAQSGMVVAYLIDTYGAQKMDKLLGLFQAGAPLDAALSEVYGIDTQGIDDAWRTSLGYGPEPGEATSVQVITATPVTIPTLALWTAEVAQAEVTNTPAPTRTRLAASPAATLADSGFTATASTVAPAAGPAPASNHNPLPGYALGAGLVAGLAALVSLFIILRYKMHKGG
jgi:hypothetical protein